MILSLKKTTKGYFVYDLECMFILDKMQNISTLNMQKKSKSEPG